MGHRSAPYHPGDVAWDARLVSEPPLLRFELSLREQPGLRGSERGVPLRLHQAATTLLASDAGITRKLDQVASATLSWTFDPRPGHERSHDRALALILPLLLPRRVVDDLYPFQRAGVAWLLRHHRAILADDMGLGKTIQAIAALRRLFRHGRVRSCLIVAPRTLLANWAAETRRWAPELVVRRLTDKPTDISATGWLYTAARAHVVLASYEEVRNPSEELISEPPGLVVADEAHRLRKSESLAHQGLRRLRLPRFWALTGTPVERYSEDLAGLLSLLEPTRFAIDDDRLGIAALRSRARPFLLRRTKETVLPELPIATEQIDEVQLHPAQRRAYNRALREFRPSDSGGGLALFTKLRSICDIDNASGASSKIDRVLEIVETATSDGHKAVVFSYLIDPLRVLQSRLQTRLGDVAALLTGELSLDARRRMVRRFRTDLQCTVLLASLRVGGEGLTLTEANHVIFLNRWWNPSTNSQAVDRVVRIGQHQPVTVHYLTCINTVEDRLQPLLDRKEMTFAQLIDALQHRPDIAKELLVP